MSTRGVLKNDVTMTTNLFSGCFLEIQIYKIDFENGNLRKFKLNSL